jgi:hypothetical protein
MACELAKQAGTIHPATDTTTTIAHRKVSVVFCSCTLPPGLYEVFVGGKDGVGASWPAGTETGSGEGSSGPGQRLEVRLQMQ